MRATIHVVSFEKIELFNDSSNETYVQFKNFWRQLFWISIFIRCILF